MSPSRRSNSASSDDCKYITVPCVSILAILSPKQGIPPPQATTVLTLLSEAIISSRRALSMLRKNSSPCESTTSAKGLPIRSSITMSVSTKSNPSLSAKALPTVDLPAAINPIRKIFTVFAIAISVGKINKIARNAIAIQKKVLPLHRLFRKIMPRWRNW